MYSGLKTLLYALSVIWAIASVVLVFAADWAVSLAPANLGLPNVALIGFFLRGIGVVGLAIAYLLCVTARDPVRYVAVIDTLVFILIASGALLAYALGAMHISQYFPANYVLMRIVLGVILAIVLIWLRPKAPRATTP